MRIAWTFLAVALVAGGIGYLIGRSPPRSDRFPVDPRVELGRDRVRDDDGDGSTAAERKSAPGPSGSDRSSGSPLPPPRDRETETEGVAGEGDDPPERAEVARFTVEGVTEAAELSQRMMGFADAQLARGEEGYLELVRALHALVENRELLRSFDDRKLTREIYPWVRFLTEREEQVIGMSEWVFRTLAEEPDAFAGVDDDVLEVFTEGLGTILPGAVSPERLQALRSHAEAFLALPEDELPESVRRQRDEVERLLLRFWTTPASEAEWLDRLKAGTLPADTAIELLGRVAPEDVAGADVTAIVEPAVSAGDFGVIGAMNRHRASLDVARLDRTLAESFGRGHKVHSLFVRRYFEATRREGWADVRPFFDQALAVHDDGGREAAATALLHLPDALAPPASYVADALSRHDFGKWGPVLRTRYELE